MTETVKRIFSQRTTGRIQNVRTWKGTETMKKKRRERDDTRCFVVNLITRVVDPYSFFTDPDPELDVGGQYGSGSKSGSGSGSKSNTDPGLKGPKIGKKLQLKIFFFFYQKLQFTYP